MLRRESLETIYYGQELSRGHQEEINTYIKDHLVMAD